MQLGKLLRGVETLSRSDVCGDLEIRGLHYDSREIQPGFLFVAMKGEASDGNRFIDAALAKGAVAIVTDSADSKDEPPRTSVPWISVAHGRRALATLSANFYAAPASRLAITGVTGTNGKTTTTFLLAQILRRAGRGEPVLIGTVEYHYARHKMAAPFTTPEALELNRIFAEATDPALPRPATEAVMEVSSHALAQERVFGIHFDVAVFTNLTQDHLDYHGSMENYFAAKAKLFAGCGSAPPRVAVINSDDEYGRRLKATAAQAESSVVTYGIDSGDVRASEIAFTPAGMDCLLTHKGRALRVHTPLVGRMNVYNLLAASAAALARGVEIETLASALSLCLGAPGRFERVDCGQPFTVIVDYAHTDDALRNLTTLAREFVSGQRPPGRVLTLFGCGGDRDRGKRPLMAAAAARGGDFVVLTSDNPRGEDPRAILADSLPGLASAGTRYAVEPDRRAAIALIIGEARPGDIVLIAGKGHEKVQIISDKRIPFDDVVVARATLEAAGYSLLAGAHGARR